LITFVLTSGRPSPTLIEAGIKNFWLSMVFSYGIWIGISLSYCFTGQTDISKALMIINCYNTELVPFIFIILGIIGKFGLFPSNPGILGIVDGISLFSTIVLLVLNKYVYLIILGLNILPYLANILLKDLCSGLLVILSLITIYHGISLNLRNFTLRKLIAGSSLISVGLCIIVLMLNDLSLTFLVLIFYLFNYISNSIGVIGILLFWKHKSSNIILNDINVEVIYNPVFYCIFILYIIGIAGFPLFILFFNKFYITCILAQDNGLSIVMELIIITLLAAN
jgi:NADH:ubiquinone oxidoreductase subunit 2 (subunit N)